MTTTSVYRIRVGSAAVIAAIVLSAGCGETTINVPLPPASVEALATTAPTGQAGAILADPIDVRVKGSDNQPLAGVTVTFSANQGGSVNPATAVTNNDGVARTRWKLGNGVGTNVLTASAGGTATTSVTATVTAARAATVALVAGDNQNAPASSAVAVAPSVRVNDAFGNVVANAIVTFSVLSGAGNVTNGVRTTNAQGIATVGSWTLGASLGVQTLAARVEESGVSNNPIVFTATATPPTGAQMVATAGDNQSAPVSSLVPVAPTVTVRSGAGNPVPGVTVTFAVASGSGAVVGAVQVTDGNGVARVGGWFLGPLPGENTLTASAPGIPSVTFTATGNSGVATTMAAISQTTQTAAIATNVADPPSVIVRDAQGIPVAGIVVTFAVTAGGGSVTGAVDTTGANGVATVGSWKLGPAVGPNTLTATAAALNSVTFNATATAGSAATVVAAAGDNQTAVQGTAVATPPTVRVTDATGNPVIGVAVTFVVTGGGGSATGLNQLTDTQGRATVGNWTLDTGAPNTMDATVAGQGITGNPVTFTAQSATQIGVTSVPSGPFTLGTNFMVTVQLRNSAGIAVAFPGKPLTIAIASGGGTLGGTPTIVTDASGTVTFTINVTVTAGAHTFRISGTGLTSVTTNSITIN